MKFRLGHGQRSSILWLIIYFLPSGVCTTVAVIFSSFKMLNVSDTHILMSPSETDGLWIGGCWSKPTCDLGFDGWKDGCLESARRDVNRGMMCRSNRVEGHEQLSTPCPTEATRSQSSEISRNRKMKWLPDLYPAFVCYINLYNVGDRLYFPWLEMEFQTVIWFKSISPWIAVFLCTSKSIKTADLYLCIHVHELLIHKFSLSSFPPSEHTIQIPLLLLFVLSHYHSWT